MVAISPNIKNSISYMTDNKGNKTAVVFDLKNKQVRSIVEDLLDTLTAIERKDELRTPLEQAISEILD